jgi:triosephosphate isomerase
MRLPFWIGTGWKMNKTLAEARDYVRILRQSPIWRDDRLRSFIIPPFTALATVRDELAGDASVADGGGILLGAQNMHWADRGAYTGEISPVMVKDCGAGLIELGHSERRALFNETDETVNLKVKAALRHGLRPLICVGETGAERQSGRAVEIVTRQVRIALADIEPAGLKQVLIAYEPVWAIGEGGVPATPEEANGMHVEIRGMLAGLAPAAADIPVLYGGSVNPDNCLALARQPAVDGLFIGRSAWDASGFLGIIASIQVALPTRDKPPTGSL